MYTVVGITPYKDPQSQKFEVATVLSFCLRNHVRNYWKRFQKEPEEFNLSAFQGFGLSRED